MFVGRDGKHTTDTINVKNFQIIHSYFGITKQHVEKPKNLAELPAKST